MYHLEHRIIRLMNEVESLIVCDSQILQNIKIRQGILDMPCDIQNITDNFKSFENGGDWSEPGCDNYALFTFDVTVPESMAGKKALLNVTTNKAGGHNMIRPQMLLYVNGEPRQGIDTNHEHYLICENAKGGESFKIHIYAFTGLTNKTPYGDWVDLNEADGVRLYVALQALCPLTEDYYYNLLTPFMYLSNFEKNSYEYKNVLNELCDSLNCLDLRNPYSKEYYDGLKNANCYLTNGLYAKNNAPEGVATMIGHTHIDIAWLWRYCHTRNKAVRSFATALELMKNNPEYYFMSSQAQLYKFVKEDCPDLYERIKQQVKDGRWEVEGAMWVEPDMNLCSGEYIIRQILYGKKFFKDEFGVDCKVLWLPDVFGYSAALPQILKKSGVDYFMTSKLATNELNRFPYDTFKWRGIDGTEILSHLTSYLPGAYNPSIEGGEVLTGWKNYQQKDINCDILIPFGYADGGGGTTQKQIEILKRMQKGLPGLPKTQFGKVCDFFERLNKNVADNRRLPVWSGELYYEKHRGTYTSMARVKRQNRKGEIMYLNAEWMWSLANALSGVKMPYDKFWQGMQNLLINQFHDVLPGSSIKDVYYDSDVLYNEAFQIGNNLIGDAIESFTHKANTDNVLVFNPYGDDVSGYVNYNNEVIYVENVPSKGYKLVSKMRDLPETPVTVTGNVMENKFFKLTISEDGYIESLWDKQNQRECFKQGRKANKLRIFEDKPGHETGWVEDNWNLDSYYTEKEYDMPKPDSIKVILNTPECAKVEILRTYGSSTMSQTIVMYARTPRIDIENKLDWKEHSQVLKAEFPIDVNALRATYEIQFGYIERPTTKNTSWEDAKFEVCAHKWADISDTGYGVSILNDCKYGYSADGSDLSITLLRCGNIPNPDADKEYHEFTYSIYPHAGSIVDADVAKEAYVLNNPLFAVDAMPMVNAPESYSLFNVKGAVLETVKPAEDGNGYILRMYEPYNRKNRVELTASNNIKSINMCDMLENDLSDNNINVLENKASFDINQFEIVTLRVIM